MITPKIEQVALVGDGIAYTLHGYENKEKVVHNLRIYATKPSDTEVAERKERWNSPAWRERNGAGTFMNSILPRNLREPSALGRGAAK